MFEHTTFHIAPWGSELAIYFFLIGTAGMAYVLATAPQVFGERAAALRALQMPGLVIALVIVGICGPLLITDLGQPSRFLYPILHFHWTSPLSWGAVFLVLFTVCILLFAFGLTQQRHDILRPVGIVGSLLGLSMPLYTGLDLMVNTTREVWNSPWMPVLFTVLSVTSGTAVMAVVAIIRSADGATRILHAILFASVGVTLALFLGLWVTFLYGSEELQVGWAILNTDFSLYVWVLTFAVGILAPLAILAMPSLWNKPTAVAAAGLAACVGAYTFREVILIAGQVPQLFY